MTTTATTEAPAVSRTVRWSTALKIVVIGGLVTACVWFWPWWEDAPHRNMAAESALAVVGLILGLWLVFFAGLPVFARLALGLLLLSLPVCFRVTCTGDLWAEIRPRSWLRGGLSLGPERVEPVSLPPITESDSPQYLGPHRDGVFADPGLARDWSAHPPQKVWRQPIGAGFASFAVVGDYAFTLEQRDGAEVVSCYEVPTGKLRWTHDLQEVPYSTNMGGDGPRSTPTIRDGRVFVCGVQGKLACLDAADGHALWSHDVVQDTKARVPMWGKSCSPLVVDDLVVVSAGGPEGYSLLAYDADDGSLRWHAGSAPASYASPMLATFDGVPQIVMVNDDSISGHDPADGHVLWTFDRPGDKPKVPQPVQVDDHRLLVAAGYGLGCKLLEIKPEGDTWSVTKIWENRSLKPKFTNVVLHDGFIYGLDDGMTLNCLDVETGKLRWRSSREDKFEHGQVLVVGDMLLVQGEYGELVLVEASPDAYRVLTRFQALDDKTWNIPTLVGSRLLVRNHLEAACYDLPLAEDK